MTIKGYADQAKTGSQQYATLQPVGTDQHGLDVTAHAFAQEVATDQAEANSTTTEIVATAHAAIRGDVIFWTTGNLASMSFAVLSVEANAITVVGEMPEAPAAADAFSVRRYAPALLNANGEMVVGVALDNDTNYGVVGSDTLRTAAQIGNDSGAADFGVGNAGAQTLRTTIADDQFALMASEATLADAEASLETIALKDFATETTLAAAAADIASIEGKDFATQTTLAAIATSLDNIEAEDFATQTTLAAAAASLASIAAEDFATAANQSTANTSLSSIDTKVGQSPQGRAYGDSARLAHTSTTTAAWVELIAATAADINALLLFDSSGQTLELGTGAAAAEARKLIIPPGGFAGPVPLRIASGTRVSVRAISATADSGELCLTGLT